MAQITLTIDDALASRVLDGFAGANNYTGTDPNGQPETKAQFLKRKLVERIRRDVKTYETSQAAQIAASNSDSQIVVT